MGGFDPRIEAIFKNEIKNGKKSSEGVVCEPRI